jgi:hypothetical protein
LILEDVNTLELSNGTGKLPVPTKVRASEVLEYGL